MDVAAPKRPVDWGGTKPRLDWCAAAPAYQLAEEIKRYWAQRGALVATRVEQIHATATPESDNVKIFYAVRSNLVRGLPNGWDAEKFIKAGQS